MTPVPPRLRSLLFLPGDRIERIERAIESGADAIILDLEDAVAPRMKDVARHNIVELISGPRRIPLFVRINALDSSMIASDVAAIFPCFPDAIVLPKANGADSIARLDAMSPVRIPILPISLETAESLPNWSAFGAIADHLIGLTWGAVDLSSELDADPAINDQGRFVATVLETARAWTVLGAKAAGLAAIDTVFPDYRNLDGLKRFATFGRQNGFSGMLAIHPDQVPIINVAFTPSSAEIARARRIVDLFGAEPERGALSLDGAMIDLPHFKRALQTLRAFGEA